MGASSRVGSAPDRFLGAGVHRISAGKQLLGAAAFGLGGALIADRMWSIEIGLVVVQQRLVFVAGTLRVIEHVL